jgi:ATP-dependent helicase/nuclease subunit B
LIFLPNRRAARELGHALQREMGTALIAPDIRALGDIEEGDGVAAFGPDAIDLPPALPAARRRGALARLIQAWRTQQGAERLPPGSALAAADELAALLDQAAISGGVDWRKLETLAPQSDLAEHWRISASFLEIVAAAWPNHLAEQGAADDQTRRCAAAKALAARWAKSPTGRPVLIAGSTGAAVATRILMAAVVALPNGVVVLPGLDPELDAAGWAAVADAASHPLHGLQQTLAWLDVSPDAVLPWPDFREQPKAEARRRLIDVALAPAETTRGWNARLDQLSGSGSAQALVQDGLDGLTLIEAEDEGEEALTAAVLLREILETPGRTAALVAQEAQLGRRVAAILERWGVDVSPTAGEPLHRTLPGSFLSIAMRWAQDPSHPVQMLALLKHALAGLGRDPETLRLEIVELEFAGLRGPRLSWTLDHLADRLHAKHPVAAKLVSDLAVVHAPFAHVFAEDPLDGAKAAEAISRMAEALAACPASPTGNRVWAKRAGAMAVKFLEELAELCAEMGGVAASLWPDFADAVAQRITAPPDGPEHPRIAIWGPLEARLQRRDRMILAGLNEGSWPKPATADAFLNRSLRKKLGLPDPDERIGLSAHDFAQMANAPEVVLLRAKRVDDKPAVASRWLWRLRTLAAGGLKSREAAEAALAPKRDRDPLAWARALQKIDMVKPAMPPAPAPPVTARGLQKFSPSRAMTLIRDPYADYARRILKLSIEPRVGETIDALARGSAVHKAVELFELKADARPLDELIVEQLLIVGAEPDLIELEKPLWLRAANAYQKWLELRAPARAKTVVEAKAGITFESQAGTVTLEATADRVEMLTSGSLAIIDFKTGQPKTAPQVQAGLEPQLALEAAIAAQAAFGGLGPAPTEELIYFRMALGAAVASEKNGQPLQFKDATTMDVAAEALAGLTRMIDAYADPTQPYYSKPRVLNLRIPEDYDRLARRAEWTADEGGEE